MMMAVEEADGQHQRRSLASLLSVSGGGSGGAAKPGGQAARLLRPKTPSVVVTDETNSGTTLSELTCIPAGKGGGLGAGLGGAPSGGRTAVNGGTLESIVTLETCSSSADPPPAVATVAAEGAGMLPTSSATTSPPTAAPGAVSSPALGPSLIRRCCQERVRKSIWGVLIMTSVSAAWVGATHLLKATFRPVQIHPVFHHNHHPPSSSSVLSAVTANNVMNGSSSIPLDGSLPADSFNRSAATINDAEFYTYEASFLNTWTVSAWTILFLPLYAAGCLLSGRMGPRKLATDIRESVLAFRDKGFTLGTFVGRCCLFCLLWVGTNWMYMYALSVLDATDVMSLFATNVSFVYLLSWVILHDQFVGLRIVAVILCNTGIALLAYMDGITRSPTLGGVVLAAAASAGSAVYKVSFKRIFGEATYGQVSFFFSLIGLLNLVLFWPILFTLHFTGLEVIIWSRVPWAQLALAGSLSLVANLLGNFGPALTYEVYVHLGLVAAIPISAGLDVSFNGVVFEGMKLAGTVMIISGFILVLLPENWPDYLTRLLRWGRHLNHSHSGLPTAAPVDLRTGYISRSHLRSPSGRVR